MALRSAGEGVLGVLFEKTSFKILRATVLHQETDRLLKNEIID